MKNKMEASKIIILASYIVGIALLIVTIFMVFLDKDTMIMGTLTGLAWAEIGVSNAFYFSKAKRENVIKISLSAIRQIQRQNKDEVKVEDINLSNLMDSINK